MEQEQKKYIIPLAKPFGDTRPEAERGAESGAGSYYRPDDGRGPAAKVAALGENTGNVFFLEAVLRHLGAAHCAFWSDVAGRPREEIRERCQAVVFPASNFVANRPLPWLESNWRATMEELDLPVYFIGLGSQIDGRPALAESTKEFYRFVADRCTSIGVRGEHTAAILDDIGVSNVRVIGCPTAFYRCDPTFAVAPRPPLAYGDKVVLTAERLRDLAFFVDFACANACLVEQRVQAPEEIRHALEDVRRDPRARLGLLTYVALRETDGHIFFNTADWLAFMADARLVVGQRFHGNMVGVQAGVPSLFLVHDNRTSELAAHLRLPTGTQAKLAGLAPSQVAAAIDYGPFNRAFPDLYRIYRDFLEENGLRHRLPASMPNGAKAPTSGLRATR